MIQSIEIENFRCFEKTEIKGFQRMNLITGKNNSGKTALLEGIYLGVTQDLVSIQSVSRNNSNDNDSWRYLFFKGSYDGLKLQISTNNHTYLSILQSNKQFMQWDEYDEDFEFYKNAAVLSQDTIYIIDKNLQLPQKQTINFLFDNIAINGNTNYIEKAIEIIDRSLDGIRTFSTKPDVLYLRTKGRGDWQPIFYFGDAIQKIVRYVVNILYFSSHKENRILLIDEIENGLHYSAQDEFWRMLFKLCIEFDIQLFATTHSLEMIKSYQRIASEFEGEAAYFEMARHAKTNQIIGIKHEMDVLEYELIANETIRGE